MGEGRGDANTDLDLLGITVALEVAANHKLPGQVGLVSSSSVSAMLLAFRRPICRGISETSARLDVNKRRCW